MISGTWLITGLRGNGKTLRAMMYIEQALAEGRPVFVSNINGIRIPGVQMLDDPRQWEDLPPGSLLVVDEAQKYWRTRRSGDPPPEVQAMETQRHTGISMLLMTQQPNYLDKHLRGLVDRHEHLVRKAGFEASFVYSWERVQEEPLNPSTIEAAEQSLWTFPKHLYAAYDSAEVHTVKRRIPTKLKLIVAAVLVMGVLVYFKVSSLASDATAAEPSLIEGASGSAAASSRGDRVMTPAQYLARFQPRFETIPGSAPAWDDREVVSEPRLFCMIGTRIKCQCLTEQATKYKVSEAVCRDLAMNGSPYDPFKAPDRARDDRRVRQNDSRQNRNDVQGREWGAGGTPAAMGASASASSSSGGDPGELAQAAYGAFRGQGSP